MRPASLLDLDGKMGWVRRSASSKRVAFLPVIPVLALASLAGSCQDSCEDIFGGRAIKGGLQLYQLTFALLPVGIITPGLKSGVLFDEAGTTQVGTVSVEFRDIPGAVYSRGSDPPHIAFADAGEVAVLASTIRLDSGEPAPVRGIKLAPLFGEGIDAANPLVIEARDRDGRVIGTQEFSAIPDNRGKEETPDLLAFDLGEGVEVATFIVGFFKRAAGAAAAPSPVSSPFFLALLHFLLIDP